MPINERVSDTGWCTECQATTVHAILGEHWVCQGCGRVTVYEVYKANPMDEVRRSQRSRGILFRGRV